MLSRYGESVWNFSPHIANANRWKSGCVIDWTGVPAKLLPAAKTIVYRYWRVGLPGSVRPMATPVISFFERLRRFLKWLDQRGIAKLAHVRAVHCMAYAEQCRHAGLSPSSLINYLATVESLYMLRAHSHDALTCHPWPETTANLLAKRYLPSRNPTEPVTQIIPKEIVQHLFQHAEIILESADRLLNQRQIENVSWDDYAFIPIRNACYFILAIVTGCRNHELASIEAGAAKTTRHDGEPYHWLCGVSLKTYTGATEWMMPFIGVRCVQIMERWSAPAREQVQREMRLLADGMDALKNGSEEQKFAMAEYCRLASLQHRLFLSYSRSTSQIVCLSCRGWNLQLGRFVRSCGTDWHLVTHQLRRTFAANVAHHVLGDLRYLRHHYKHWSMDMTTLYALNAQQEQELFDEVLFAVREKKVAIVQHWLDDTNVITGGAAGPIKAFRQQHAVTVLKSRRALAEETADKVRIRATGHGWCLAMNDGCGGQGLYERTRCVDCRNSVIEKAHPPVWTRLFHQQKELLATGDSCDPGGRLRIKRDLAGAAKVLGALGVDVSGIPEIKEE